LTTLSVSIRERRASVPGESMTVAVTGELDIATAPRFSARLGELLRRGYPRELIIDLSGVSFIDASGLRALTELRSRVERQQSVLVLEGVPAQMRRVIQLIGPTRRFRIRS
jgi:anti-sigma B factor antagonist